MEKEKPVGDLSGMLGSILSDPEQMAKLTQLAGALASSGGLASLLGGGAQGKETEEKTEQTGQSAAPSADLALPQQADGGSSAPFANDAMTSAPAKLGGSMGKGQVSKHEALLRALRPYLSDGRQSRIDHLLRLLTLVNVLVNALQTMGDTSILPRTP